MKQRKDTESEINRIRFEIYEETKDLTPEQRVERTRRITDPIIEKYGLTVIAGTKDDPRLQARRFRESAARGRMTN
jgi:hypothetical protein